MHRPERRCRSRYSQIMLVGAEGFEPPTLCSQSRCATRLRYAPTTSFDCSPNPSAKALQSTQSAAG